MLASVAAALAAPAAANAAFEYGVASNTSLAGISQLPSRNVTVVRTDADWNLAAPTPRAGYDWSFADRLVTSIATAGMTWLPLHSYDAPWDESLPGDPYSAPADDNAYADFAGALAARYGPGGTFWASHPQVPYHPISAVEVWNEENTPMFWHPQDASAPSRYYQLYAQAKAAIAAANPQVAAMFGGLLDSAATPIPWLSQLRDQNPGALANVTEFGWHPYLYSLPTTQQRLQDLRKLLDSSGASGRPIAITEVGDATTFTGGDSNLWSDLLARLARELPSSGCGVNMLAPFVWQDLPALPGVAGALNRDGWYTLSYGDGTLTPVGAAYVAATSQPPAAPQPGTWCNAAPQRSNAPIQRYMHVQVSVVRAKRHVRVRVRVAAGSGSFSVMLARHHHRRVLRIHRKRFAVTLPPGHWTVVVRSIPAPGYAASAPVRRQV